MLLIKKERTRPNIGHGLKHRECKAYKITYKPLHLWLVRHNMKIKEFAEKIDVPHSHFIHWLESNDPHISTLLKIIMGTDYDLKLEDFIEEIDD